MQDEILERLRQYCIVNNLRIFVVARKPRLRFRLEGDSVQFGSGLSAKLEKVVNDPNLSVHCTSGSAGSMNFSVWKNNENPWQEAAEKRKVEDIESGRRFPKANTSTAAFPHCDQRILHAPSECVWCDKFPVYQYYRQALGINFTGHRLSGLTKCPAEVARNLSVIEKWHGNVPMTQADIDRAEEETRKMFEEIAEKRHE